MSGTDDRITLENVSKFYGEVLGVNRIDGTLITVGEIAEALR